MFFILLPLKSYFLHGVYVSNDCLATHFFRLFDMMYGNRKKWKIRAVITGKSYERTIGAAYRLHWEIINDFHASWLLICFSHSLMINARIQRIASFTYSLLHAINYLYVHCVGLVTAFVALIVYLAVVCIATLSCWLYKRFMSCHCIHKNYYSAA